MRISDWSSDVCSSDLLPDGTVRVLVEGKQRATLEGLSQEDGYILADVIAQEEKVASGPEAAALMRSVVEQFDNYAKLNKKLPAETPVQLSELEHAARLADAAASNISAKGAYKKTMVSERDPGKR